MADPAHDASGPVSAAQQASRSDSLDRGKLRVFISYSRDDLAYADQLDAALNTCGFECLIDRHGISGGEDWKRRLGNLISEADTVVFVLSPSSARSEICAWEVDEAAQLNKRILPVICRSLEGVNPPPRLRDLNYMFFYAEPKVPGSGFGTGLANLVAALSTDFDWLREHTRYLQRAMEWDKGGRPANRLLSGNDILDAKAWVARRPKGAPEPTVLHLDFIRASEEEAEARLSEQRKQLEAMAAAQAERETALHDREEALKQRARVARVRNFALVAVSILALLAVATSALSFWSYGRAKQNQILAEQQKQIAEQQKGEADDILARALKITLNEAGRMQVETQQEVFALFTAGARHGNARATGLLGFAYLSGFGVGRDLTKAREFYEKAAATDDSFAMYNLAIFYQSGVPQDDVPQDYVKARELYEKAAAKGFVDAMVDLGMLYQTGLGVPPDYVKARELYEKAAAKDNATAINNLGALYANGRGVPQDDAKAHELFEKAAAMDNAPAMFNLGLFYANGQGVPEDYAKAGEWFEKAAAKGHSAAMLNLGLFYFKGAGVPQDYAKAREWWEKAAAKDDPKAMVGAMVGLGTAEDNATAMSNLGTLYANGFGVTQDFTTAREWWEKAAAKDDPKAMVGLGALYDSGQGVPQDSAKAREWYEKAAAKGHEGAMSKLGDHFANGLGVPLDYAKAREWWEKAAAKDDAGAMYNLGVLFRYGRGVAQDLTNAREWWEKAAAKDDAAAMNGLGTLYHDGKGVPQNYAKAREWYERAAAKGYADAMDNLSRLYFRGHGVPQNYDTAREWAEKAADKGHTEAMAKLGWLYDKGQGVPQDSAKARVWYEKAAAKDNEDAKMALERLSINEAKSAGRYAEALQLQEALAAKREAEETKRDGKAGEQTAGELTHVIWYALFAKEFTKALTVANRSHVLFPDDLVIETNRAHALMFMERGEEAKALYLAHKGEPVSPHNRLWEQVIAEDFAEFRKAGLTHPMMGDIEKELGVSR